MPSPAIRYSGRTAVTISAETSVTRLTSPSANTVPGTALRGPFGAGVRVSPAMSEARLVDRYTDASREVSRTS